MQLESLSIIMYCNSFQSMDVCKNIEIDEDTRS